MSDTLSTLPAELSTLLHDLVDAVRAALGDNLVGVYLYGSLTQHAFDPSRSDVDCIVVTQLPLSEAEFARVAAWLDAARSDHSWASRLQISWMIRDRVLTPSPGGNCLYQFGRLTRVGSDGNPIVWMNVLQSGIVLFGPPAKSFVAPITAELLRAALAREVGYLREEIVTKPESEWRDVPMYRGYAVLTLCRILHSLEHGTVVSKPAAAEWALHALPGRWHDAITQALGSGAAPPVADIDLDTIARFIEFADAQLAAATVRV